MSRDLKEIFDLDQLRRAWDPNARAAIVPNPRGEAVPPPVLETAPLRILEKLEAAIGEEFQGDKQPLFRPTIEGIRALLDVGTARELSAARYTDLANHFDALEDLLDALSLPPPGSAETSV